MAQSAPIASAFAPRLSASLALVAALSMAAPAHAADIPQAPARSISSGSTAVVLEQISSAAYDPEAEVSDWRRCGWYGCGWRRVYHGHHGHHGHHGGSPGAVLAGAIIIGGIAALASSANNNRRNQPDVVVVEREVRDYDRRDGDRRDNPRSSSTGSGIDNAVDICLDAIERDVRVDSVNSAMRISSGWAVGGSIFDGSSFTCEVGNNGRIKNIKYGRVSHSGATGAGVQYARQWSDDRYADARASIDAQGADQRAGSSEEAQPLVALSTERMPAYPGGPVPGETYLDK